MSDIEPLLVHPHPATEIRFGKVRCDSVSGEKYLEVRIVNTERGDELESSFFIDDVIALEIINRMEQIIELTK